MISMRHTGLQSFRQTTSSSKRTCIVKVKWFRQKGYNEKKPDHFGKLTIMFGK